MNIVLGESGFPEHPVDAYRYFIGDGIDLLVERALPEEKHDPETAQTYVSAMKSEYARCWTNKTRPYTGIPELVDGCTAAGLKIAIVTNKPDGPTREMVARLLPRAPFESIMGARPGLPTKPDPTGALDTARKLGVAPEQCIFLGDMAVDMETAASSSMYAVGALWGFRSAEELFSAGAQMVVRTPVDLLPWLEGPKK